MTMFVGRNLELARLQNHLEQATQGKGTVVVIEGEAGIGKTSLVTQFFEMNHAKCNLVTARGQCNAISGQGDAFMPFRQILKQVALVEHESGKLDKGKHFDFMARVAPAWISVIPGIGALIAALVQTGVEARETYLPRDNLSSFTKEQMLEQFSQVLHHLSQENTLAILIDDLQWADSASLSLLFHLARNISNYRLLLLCTYRSSDIETSKSERYSVLKDTLFEMRRYDLCTDLFLGQLPQIQIVEMIDLEFPVNQFSTEVASLLFKRSGGNPLFVASFLNLLRAQRIVREGKNGWYFAKPLATVQIPTQIEAVIRKRLERLTEDLRDFCDVASVEGMAFTYEAIAAIIKQEFKRGDLEIGKQARALQTTHQLIQEQGEIQLSQSQVLLIYGFTHGLFQEVVYRDLSLSLRQQYHRLIGDTLEELYAEHLDEIAPQLAIHFKHGKQMDKSTHYFYLAGMKAAHYLSATSEAIYNFQNAVDLLETLPAQKRDLYLLANCYKELAFAHSMLMGQFDKGISYFDKSTRLFRELPNQEEKILECLHLIGVCHRGIEEFARARDYYEQALVVAQKLDRQGSIGNILRDMGTSYYLEGDLDIAIGYFEHSLAILSSVQDEGGTANTMRRLGNVYQAIGELDKARKLYDESLEIHHRSRGFIHEMQLYKDMSTLAFQKGNDEQGFIFAKTARKIGEQHEFYHQLTELLTFEAQKHSERRQYSQSFHVYAQAVVYAYKCNPHEYHKTLLTIFTQVKELYARGRSEMASHFCDVLIESWESQGLDRKSPSFIGIWREVKRHLRTGLDNFDWDSFTTEDGIGLAQEPC